MLSVFLQPSHELQKFATATLFDNPGTIPPVGGPDLSVGFPFVLPNTQNLSATNLAEFIKSGAAWLFAVGTLFLVNLLAYLPLLGHKFLDTVTAKP